MLERYPEYYEKFSCIAGDCEDTCCAGWEIDIDEESYAAYMQIEGEFGDRLRNCIKTYAEEYDTVSEESSDFSEDRDESRESYREIYEEHGFVLTEDKRCSFLNEKNLCDIYRELGEEALCEVCTNTPRNFLEYGGAREISISASCPESARLLYGSSEPIRFVEKEIEGELDFEESEEELRLAEYIRRRRDEAIEILQDREYDLSQRIAHFLKHAERVQAELNDEEKKSNMSATKSKSEQNGNIYENFLIRMRLFSGLASIGDSWKESVERIYRLFIEEGDEEKSDGLSGEQVSETDFSSDLSEKYANTLTQFKSYIRSQDREYEYEHLLVYYAFLLLSRCVDDMDYISKAKLVVLSYLMNRDMDAATFAEKGTFTKQDRERNARIYAREVEHAEENMADIYEEILFEETFSTGEQISIL